MQVLFFSFAFILLQKHFVYSKFIALGVSLELKVHVGGERVVKDGLSLLLAGKR
jgi:hypothetical protein